jgi:hypothetical protein
MSPKNQKIRHLSNCQVASGSIPEGCAVITVKRSSSNMPSAKRKEEANQQLYLKRI